MVVSARGAAEILRVAGLSRDEASQLLAAQFAGPGERTPSAVLYDERRVHDLTRWPRIEDETVEDLCPFGMFVGRIARGRPVNVNTDRSVLADSVKSGWKVPLLSRILIVSRVERFGPMPFVATVCGYVGFGADLLGLQVDGQGKTTFVLGDPGPWFEGFDQYRLVAGAGRSCFIWGWPPQYRA